ncbi:hypothetical protein pdam_00023561 [Pocillopora damicornis]|uniref:Uncharacterized protein n=1 Tax=Pocillopora damicornis TaxID=46731 RepID=A0A3M6V690_POCDA|nr:hypothetical protein pdam_00023561 [Pocillopora damicornis]
MRCGCWKLPFLSWIGICPLTR